MSDLVAIVARPSAVFVDQLLRIWGDGDAVLPIDHRLPPQSQARLARSMAAGRLIDGQDELILDGSRPLEPGDAVVVTTSGTTGSPKGAVLTHDALLASALLTTSALGVTRSHKWLACLPFAHIGGLSVLTRALLTETPFEVANGGFEVSRVEAAAREGATHVALVTTAMQRIDTSLFEQILLGGGPRPISCPSNAVVTYGSTETASGVVYDGAPLPGVELRIDDQSRLFVKSPTLLRCYRDGTVPIDSDGWFETHDAGTLDTSGKLSIHGRFDDAIITGGEKVWPATVEAALRSLHQVGEVVVFGEADPDWGERVVARIEGLPTPEGDLIELAKEALPSYAVPKRWEFVERLDRTPSGKVKRPSR